MRDITFRDCIEFQECFLFDGKFSPFENVGDFRQYFPRVLVGEIGGLVNLSCKQVRSPNVYDSEIEDECADIFIYLLLFGRMLEIHDQKNVLKSIGAQWHKAFPPIRTEREYYDCCMDMMERALSFLKPGKEQCYTEEYFRNFFALILQANYYITCNEWQSVINKFHHQVILKHTDPACFTFDGLYKASFRINIGKLLMFITNVGMQLPEKRIAYLKRVEYTQSSFFISTSGAASAR